LPNFGEGIVGDDILKVKHQEIPSAWVSVNSETRRPDDYTCVSLSYSIDLIPDLGRDEQSENHKHSLVVKSMVVMKRRKNQTTQKREF